MKLACLILVLAGVVLAADFSVRTNVAWVGKPVPVRDTNQIRLHISNCVYPPATTNTFAFRDMDYTATNVLIESSHEPVLLGKSNGVWWIVFR